MSDATKTSTPSQHQIRADHEAMVRGDLIGRISGESEALMVKDECGRWASYRLSERLVDSGCNAGGTPDIRARSSGHRPGTPDITVLHGGMSDRSSPHNAGSSPHSGPSSPHKVTSSPHSDRSSRQNHSVLALHTCQTNPDWRES